MYLVHLTSLIVIALTGVALWSCGVRWCQSRGISERASLRALAIVPALAGVIVSIHLLALASLATGGAYVTPMTVAMIFVAIALLVHRLAKRDVRSGADVTTGEAAMSDQVTLATTDAGAKAVEKVPRWWWFPVLVVGGMYGVFAFDALTRPPTGYDALHYHLPVAFGWAKAQRLDLVFGLAHPSFPNNGNLPTFLLAFIKPERLLPLVHLPEIAWLGFVTYGLATQLGAGRRAAMAGVCIMLSVPLVVFQAFSGYIDLFGTSAWLSALLALMWATRTTDHRARRDLILLAGVAAGIALGSKTTYLVLVPLLGLVAIATEWIRPKGVMYVARRPIRTGMLFGAAALVCSGFWFIRGTVQAGNPVYPLRVEIAGREILPGFSADQYFPWRTTEQKLRRWSQYPWQESKIVGAGYPQGVSNGLGAAYAVFVPLGLLAVAISRRIRRPREPADAWLLVGVLVTGVGAVLLLTVLEESIRFVLPFVVLAVPITAVMIDGLIARLERATLALLTLSLLVSAATASFRPAHALAGRLRDGVWRRADAYQIPRLIDDLPPGSRIVNLNAPAFTYPLMGRHLTHEVLTPHEWKLRLSTGGTFEETLRAQRIDYVYMRNHPPELRDKALCTDLPAGLPVELVFEGRNIAAPPTAQPSRLYRVLSGQEPVSTSLAQTD